MMDKDKNWVTEKILNLTLEIICLLTGEDYIVVKKQTFTDTGRISPCITEGFRRSQSPILVSSPKSPVLEKDNDKMVLDLTNKILHLPTAEVVVRCEDVSAYQSTEEWEYGEDQKEVTMKNRQTIPLARDNENQDLLMVNERDSEMIVTDLQEPKKEIDHADSCADGSSNRNTPERRPIHPYSQNCTEEDNRTTQDYKVEQVDMAFPPKCKEEEIPTEISTGLAISWEAHPEEQQVSFPAPEYVLNNKHVAQSDQESHLATQNSTCEIVRKPVGIMDKNSMSREGSNLTETSINNPLDLIFQHKALGDEKKQNFSLQQEFFTANIELVTHQISQEGEDAFLCSECGEYFTCNSDLIEHKNIHTDEKSFPYSEYGKCFTQVANLVAPPKLLTGEKPCVCLECGKYFTNNLDLITHQASHTEEKPIASSESRQSFNKRSSLLAHKLIHTASKQFVCSNCGERFAYKSDLVKHHRVHVEEKPFACSECGKCFAQLTHLLEHQRSHTVDKPFVCSVCGKCFTNNLDLVAHMRIHTEETQLLYAKGETSFTHTSSYFVNQNIHRGDKPYACSDCGKCFTYRSAYVRHQRIHTGEKPFVCSHCGKCFTQKTHLITHQRVHKENKSV